MATNQSAIESRHIDYVPEGERHGVLWRQGPFWFLGNFQPFTVGIGFLGPAFGLNFMWSAIAAITGVLFGTLFMAAHAAQGPRLGLPQMIQSRAQFGYVGVILPLLATTFTFVAFNVADTVIIKEGLKGIFGWDATVIAVVITAIATLLAIYGHDWLHKVFYALFWMSLPFWAILIANVMLGNVATTGTDAGAFSVPGFIGMFAVAASYNITYAPYVSDYSRYLPKETPQRTIIASVFFGASGSPILLMPLGAWLAIHLGVADALVGIHDAGNQLVGNLGTILALLSVGALVATMGMNAYSGMLSVVTAVDSFRPVSPGSKARVTTILALAALWLAMGIALADAISVVFNSLIVMLYLLSPWTAINLVDFYYVRHGRYAIADLFTPSGIYGRWGRRGVVTYLVGIAIEVPFMYIPGWYESWGTLKLQYVDIAWILGLAVSGGLYWALTRDLNLAAEQPAIEASSRKLHETGTAR